MFTKSGIMVGLGETREEVLQVMDDLRSADVDFLTIGQYLQPTRKHAEVKRFMHARRVQGLRERRRCAKGFLMVSASPLTRSSYHAGDDFARLRAARLAEAEPGPGPAEQPMSGKIVYRCTQCEKVHEGLPAIAFDAPRTTITSCRGGARGNEQS